MFFDSDYITFEQEKNTVTIAKSARVMPITVLKTEHKRVHRVAEDLKNDLEKVTGNKPDLFNTIPNCPSIIIGTVENSDLMEQAGMNGDDLKGKWESFIIQTVILEGQSDPSVIILGSDDRGAIFGVYDLTEKIGVSPWYWWMDVPVKTHDALYLKEGKVLKGEPSVQYRGFFLNDEGPSLMTWVRTHFPDFTHEFYEKIFELTLRLKANYHWPAMWDSTFYEDDEKNIETADLYGVVIGTSHHEPMDRPHGDWKTHKKGPWDYAENADYLKEFWSEGIERSKPYETIINLGMRGDGDEPMGGKLSFQEKIQLMEKIISDQRQIIQDTMEVSVEDVPQMWALYKEVKEYYDSGLSVPEDVTLLWGDDNFGNIRRLPTEEERERKGGAGIYYHFDYVGGPRSYKWVNTVPIQKTYEQMQKAYAYDARKVWIVNVGDLKPMEYQTEFFLRLAWDIEAFSPENLEQYALDWAAYTFGAEYAPDAAKVIRDYVKFNGRLKPEVINLVDLYSWENEYEAERTLNEFQKTVDLAEKLLQTLPHNLRDAFFQVGYYPAKASFTVLKLQLMADLSKLYKAEGRVAANVAALEAQRLFDEDKRLTFEYNKRVSNGKWDHMMDQLHIGYTYWQQPDDLIMPEIAFLSDEESADGKFGIKVYGEAITDRYTRKPLFVDVYNRGRELVEIKVVTDKRWADLDYSAFTLSIQRRLELSVDWDKAPKGKSDITLTVTSNQGQTETVVCQIDNPETLLSGGFVPSGGKIAIEAVDYSDKQEAGPHKWTEIPDYGRTKSSMAIYPVEYRKDYSPEDVPRLSYDFFLPEKTDIEVTVITAPSLPFDPAREMRLGMSLDEDELIMQNPGDLSQNGKHDSPDWEKSVILNCHTYSLKNSGLTEGKHTLHVSLVDPQVVIQKIIIDCGGLKPTLLGPQPTPHADQLNDYIYEGPCNIEDFSLVPGKVTTEAVYVETTGFYRVKLEDQEAVDSGNLIFLDQGLTKLDKLFSGNQFTLELDREWPLSVTARVNKTSAGIWSVAVMLHYFGKASMPYQIDVELSGAGRTELCGRSRGWLKTDEQQVVNYLCKKEANWTPDNVIIHISDDQDEHRINYSIDKYEVREKD